MPIIVKPDEVVPVRTIKPTPILTVGQLLKQEEESLGIKVRPVLFTLWWILGDNQVFVDGRLVAHTYIDASGNEGIVIDDAGYNDLFVETAGRLEKNESMGQITVHLK